MRIRHLRRGHLWILGLLSACGDGAPIAAQPVADAGFDRWDVHLGAEVILDGSQSFDPDGEELTYTWTLVSQPQGSTTTLQTGADPRHPRIVPDVAGFYLVSLRVQNSARDSRPDLVAVTARNFPPVTLVQCQDPNACTVHHGSTVDLVGVLSEDPEGAALTYEWAQLSAPTPGECAALCPGLTQGNPCDTPVPSIFNRLTSRATVILADVTETDFIFQLETNDGLHRSTACLVYTTDNDVPTFQPGQTRATPASPNEGATFTLSTLTFADLDEPLTYTWSQVSPASPEVEFLSGNVGASISVRLPADSIDAPTEFVFEVEASDGLDHATTQVTVIIQDT